MTAMPKFPWYVPLIVFDFTKHPRFALIFSTFLTIWINLVLYGFALVLLWDYFKWRAP